MRFFDIKQYFGGDKELVVVIHLHYYSKAEAKKIRENIAILLEKLFLPPKKEKISDD